MSYVKKTHRFGLLTPSSNTVQEPEFSAALPPTISLHTGRVARRDITTQEQMRCVLELESECRKLADAEVDVIVFAATAPTLANGKGYDRELIKRMEDASSRPATTAATAFVDALARLHVTRSAIAAPREQHHGHADGALHGGERLRGGQQRGRRIRRRRRVGPHRSGGGLRARPPRRPARRRGRHHAGRQLAGDEHRGAARRRAPR